MKDEKIIVMPKPTIELALHNWSYRDFMKFQQYNTTAPLRAYALVQKIIKSWSYPIPVDEQDALSRLDLEDAAEVMITIAQNLEVYFEQMDASEVSVDFRKGGWNLIIIEEFKAALKSFDYPTIVNLMHQVATLEGVTPKGALPMIEGAMMVKAITEHYTKLMSGKV